MRQNNSEESFTNCYIKNFGTLLSEEQLQEMFQVDNFIFITYKFFLFS